MPPPHGLTCLDVYVPTSWTYLFRMIMSPPRGLTCLCWPLLCLSRVWRFFRNWALLCGVQSLVILQKLGTSVWSPEFGDFSEIRHFCVESRVRRFFRNLALLCGIWNSSIFRNWQLLWGGQSSAIFQKLGTSVWKFRVR
jgi:hypothetical protein